MLFRSKDFIKARTAIDKFRQQRCKQLSAEVRRGGITVEFTTEDPPGVECPESNCVILGTTKRHKHHKGNIDFHDMIGKMVLLEEQNKANGMAPDSSSSHNANITDAAIGIAGTVVNVNADAATTCSTAAVIAAASAAAGTPIGPSVRAALFIDTIIEDWVIDKINEIYKINQFKMDRLAQLTKIQTEARELFQKKNKDYGDAFATYGPVGVLVRMGDKITKIGRAHV